VPRPSIMAPHGLVACLIAFVLVPACSGAGTKAKAKAKAKDPWDVPDGSEELEAAPPMANMESEMSPEDQASIMEQVARRSATRRANSQHAVMKQFMQNFANNMRLSVLADSRGDMPEEERQRLIAKAEAQREASMGEPVGEDGDGPGMGPPPAEADGGEEMPPPPPQRRPRHRMLNMAEARHQRRHPRPRLLPEAEGIGFPAPEGMASDPATDGIVNDPGMASTQSFDAPPAEFDAPPAPRPRRHHLHMLNMRPGEGKAHHHHKHASSGEHKLPPGVVKDEMGRAMPLLFTGSNPAHSGAFHAVHAPLVAIAIACVFLTPW